MLSKLINNISGQKPDDFWYDVQIDVVQDILNAFENKQWQELCEFIPFKRAEENWCLLDCLSGCINPFAVRCIEKILLSKNDIETIKFAVLSLESQDISLFTQDSKDKIIAFSNRIISATNNEVVKSKLANICDSLR